MRRILPKRLPVPKPMDGPEREYMRFLLMYQRQFADLLREGLSELIPDLKQLLRQETPPEMRTDSIRRSEENKSADLLIAKGEPTLRGFTTLNSRLLKSSFSAGDKVEPSGQDSFACKRIRMDTNAPKAIAKLFETLENRIQNQFPDTILRRWAMNMIGSVNRANKSNLKKITKAVDLDIEPLIDKDHHELSPYFNNIVDENVQLIRTIPKSQLGSLQNALVNAIKNDMSQKDIAGIVRKYFATNDGHAANKARLIARDQVNKLNGKLNQYRQQKLGGKRYRWKGMLDSAERPDHRKLQNKIFSWDNPPVVDSRTGRRGHPGEDYQCRCYPELVFEDIIE